MSNVVGIIPKAGIALYAVNEQQNFTFAPMPIKTSKEISSQELGQLLLEANPVVITIERYEGVNKLDLINYGIILGTCGLLTDINVLDIRTKAWRKHYGLPTKNDKGIKQSAHLQHFGIAFKDTEQAKCCYVAAYGYHVCEVTSHSDLVMP